MTKLERDKIIKKMSDFTKKLTQEEARKFLLSTGIYTKNGNLRKAYK
jgi:hypothetical protein